MPNDMEGKKIKMKGKSIKKIVGPRNTEYVCPGDCATLIVGSSVGPKKLIIEY